MTDIQLMDTFRLFIIPEKNPQSGDMASCHLLSSTDNLSSIAVLVMSEKESAEEFEQRLCNYSIKNLRIWLSFKKEQNPRMKVKICLYSKYQHHENLASWQAELEACSIENEQFTEEKYQHALQEVSPKKKKKTKNFRI